MAHNNNKPQLRPGEVPEIDELRISWRQSVGMGIFAAGVVTGLGQMGKVVDSLGTATDSRTSENPIVRQMATPYDGYNDAAGNVFYTAPDENNPRVGFQILNNVEPLVDPLSGTPEASNMEQNE